MDYKEAAKNLQNEGERRVNYLAEMLKRDLRTAIDGVYRRLDDLDALVGAYEAQRTEGVTAASKKSTKVAQPKAEKDGWRDKIASIINTYSMGAQFTANDIAKQTSLSVGSVAQYLKQGNRKLFGISYDRSTGTGTYRRIDKRNGREKVIEACERGSYNLEALAKETGLPRPTIGAIKARWTRRTYKKGLDKK